MQPTNKPLEGVELIKDKSNYLRGTIKESLANDITGSMAEDDTQLIKFHGIYQQTDRDLDSERKTQKLEPLYSFMVRVRVPGGVATPEQWLVMDHLSSTYGNNTMKLTTRQAFQFHGIYKKKIKPLMQEMNAILMDSIAACGDVNRNVMCSPTHGQSPLHDQVVDFSKKISEHLLPKTRAYHEIWLNEELVAGGEPKETVEPIYGKHYLPRKFKIALAIPPYNDTDVYANDLGLIAIEENGALAGFNITVGGGMGMTFGMKETFPRLADVIGFCTPEKTIQLVEEIVKIQRDFGNRENRKLSRFKYTIASRGIAWFIEELENRLGFSLEKSKPYTFKTSGDEYGWKKGTNGQWFLGLFIENGRVQDTPQYKLKTGLREIAKIHTGDFRITGNQHLVLGNISPDNKDKIQALLLTYKINDRLYQSNLRQHAMACVAFNTCTLAFAEGERYLPSLIDKLEVILAANGLTEEAILVRLTGCPNGCARPYLGEIGFVGRSPGFYNLYLGASRNGDRLNTLYKEMCNERQILDALIPLIEQFAKERKEKEHFGDFVIRKKIVTPGQQVHIAK